MALVTDSEERLRVASRAPVDVFVPTFDDARFVSDHTGNYWPYRWTTHRKAEKERRAVERTIDRCETFRLDQGIGDPIVGPAEVYATARTIGADEVVPRPLTSGRYQWEELVDDYVNYDFQTRVRLLLAISTLSPTYVSFLCQRIAACDRQLTASPDICLYQPKGTDFQDAIKGARLVREDLSGDTCVHLVGASPSVELAKVIREEPNLFDSIALSQDFIAEEQASSVNGLSAAGRRDLRSDPDPAVSAAADFSLLCSQYIDDNGLHKAGEQSIVPVSCPERE